MRGFPVPESCRVPLDPAFAGPAGPGRMAFAIVPRDPAETPGALDRVRVAPFQVLPRGDGTAAATTATRCGSVMRVRPEGDRPLANGFGGSP